MNKNNNHFNSPEGVSLKEYVNDKMDNLEKAIDARFESITQMTNSALLSADKATSKAEAAANERFASVNEFRNTLSDQQRNFVPRTELEVMIKAINDKINALDLTIIAKQGKDSGQREGMGIVALIAGLVSALFVVISRFIK